MSKWVHRGEEPPIASRMYWDLAKDECPCCAAGEFPFSGTPEEGLEHPGELPCLANKIHRMFRTHIKDNAKLDPFKRKIIMGKLDVWTPMTLAAILRRCDIEYHRDDGEGGMTLEDHEYDRVQRRLAHLAPDHPQLQVVGGGVMPPKLTGKAARRYR